MTRPRETRSLTASLASEMICFNKRYSNPVSDDNTTVWDVPLDSNGNKVLIYGYPIEKAEVQSDEGKIRKVCFITAVNNWRKEVTAADSLKIANECVNYINKTTNNMPITHAEFSASEDINLAREYIDNFLKTVMKIEEREMKNIKEKGKIFIGSQEWEKPFVIGEPLSTNYSTMDLDRRYNECMKRFMIMDALEKEKTILTYYCNNIYASLTLYSATLKIEFGYNTDLSIEKTPEGYTLNGLM